MTQTTTSQTRSELYDKALQLKKEGFYFKLHILGDGGLRNELQRYIDNNQLQ